MKTMMGDHADDLKVMNFISAQAVKDATMAESIINNLEPGKPLSTTMETITARNMVVYTGI